MGNLDRQLGKAFASSVNELLKRQSLPSQAIRAIGSHGQTIRHFPHHPHPFTLQIGDPNTIAAETGITTVADFRRKDMACGGQGAPLVPAFHQAALASDQCNRAIINIGGIANVTLLPHKTPHQVLGFDTGPGNTLLDAWIQQHQKTSHDHQGEWGAEGSVQSDLLGRLLSDPYFVLTPPKSTGREYFHLAWLKKYLADLNRKVTPVDVQATLVELTASSILSAVRRHLSSGEILICGGGAHNTCLMTRLRTLAAPSFTLSTTQACGIDPDWVEAIAFAWLAKQTLHQQPGNIPRVTGATRSAILGGIYYS